MLSNYNLGYIRGFRFRSLKVSPFYEMNYPQAKVCFQLWEDHPKLKISKFHLKLFHLFFSTHIPFISFHRVFRATVTVGVPSVKNFPLSAPFPTLHPPSPPTSELMRALNLGRCAAFLSMACRSKVSKRKCMCVCWGGVVSIATLSPGCGVEVTGRPCSKSCLTSELYLIRD